MGEPKPQRGRFGDIKWTLGYQHLETPIGELCPQCDEPIEAGDDGEMMCFVAVGEASALRPQHRECLVRAIAGSIGHQLRLCSCHGGSWEDPPGVSRREAARAAERLFEEMDRAKRLLFAVVPPE